MKHEKLTNFVCPIICLSMQIFAEPVLLPVQKQELVFQLVYSILWNVIQNKKWEKLVLSGFS